MLPVLGVKNPLLRTITNSRETRAIYVKGLVRYCGAIELVIAPSVPHAKQNGRLKGCVWKLTQRHSRGLRFVYMQDNMVIGISRKGRHAFLQARSSAGATSCSVGWWPICISEVSNTYSIWPRFQR